MRVAVMIAAAASLGARAPSLHAQVLPTKALLATTAPDSFVVVFETTKGNVALKAHRAWSPLGVDRLYQLASSGYYNGAVIYRVGPTASYKGGWVVQFGLSSDPRVNAAWEGQTITDEPVRRGARRGSVNFARGGPNTRGVEIAFNLTPNTALDTVHYEGVVGFPAIADIVEGIEVADAFNRTYGNAPNAHADSIFAKGRAYLDRAYPGLDRITAVRVREEWSARRR